MKKHSLSASFFSSFSTSRQTEFQTSEKMSAQVTDFTDDELRALKVACGLVTITEQDGTLPRAQSALVARLKQTLVQLAAYKRAARASASPLAAWPASCERFFSVELPASCEQRASLLSTPDVTLSSVERQMKHARELAVQTGVATVVSAAHMAKGCNRGRACVFCF